MPRWIGSRRTPAARNACIAAAVSFESAAPPASQGQPPEGRCAARAALDETRAATGSPACRSARIVQIVAFTSFPGVWLRRRGRRSSGWSPAAARAIATSATSVGVSGFCIARYSAARPVSAPAATSPSVAQAVICGSPKPPSSRCSDWT